MVVYQLHIGTYAPSAPGCASTFLDVVEKIEYLVALGVNVVQPLPVYEMEDSPSLGYPGLGYQGADLYSPAFDYTVYDCGGLQALSGNDQPAAGGEGVCADDAGDILRRWRR